jgi:hypothetical protein
MKNLTKKSCISVGLFCVVVFLSSNVWAISLTFNPDMASIGISDPIDVDIVISDLGEFDDLAAFDLDVGYDDTILAYSGYTLGSDLGSPLDSVDASSGYIGDGLGNGVINLAEVSFLWDFSSQPDSFTLATVSFVGDMEGSSSLAFSNVILSDPLGLSLGVPSLGDGSITVESGQVAPVPEPATILLMISGLFGMGVFGRKRLIQK